MISFPNAKINVGLEVISRRSNGYHNIQSIFYPVPLFDALEFVPATDGKDFFKSSGLLIPGDPANNLCLKTLRLVREQSDIPPLHIWLHKNIPMGAGLGGGSADAAFLLKMLNEYFQLNLEQSTLLNIAMDVGADCPFFLNNQPCRVSGIGEQLSPSSLDLSGYNLLLLHPEIHINTAEAYAAITPRKTVVNIFELAESKPPQEWSSIRNRFEEYVFANYPEVEQLKIQLLEAGALYASMSGSGSVVYGIFKNTPPDSVKQNFSGKIFHLKL